jgi:hypothetical protein
MTKVFLFLVVAILLGMFVGSTLAYYTVSGQQVRFHSFLPPNWNHIQPKPCIYCGGAPPESDSPMACGGNASNPTNETLCPWIGN